MIKYFYILFVFVGIIIVLLRKLTLVFTFFIIKTSLVMRMPVSIKCWLQYTLRNFKTIKYHDKKSMEIKEMSNKCLQNDLF